MPRVVSVWLGRPAPLIEQYFRQHVSWLRRMLYGRVATSDIEDVLQETFRRALQYPTTTAIKSPRGLLLKIAVNVAADNYTRARRRRFVEAESQYVAVPWSDAGETAALKQLLLSLPETYRDTFLMSRFLGLTHQEIADRLGISVKTVEWRVSKAMALCRQLLED